MKLNPVLSIIVPVYNAEKYIDKCVNCLRKQITSGFEIILVDDGSKDTSANICDKLAQSDYHIKVLHKSNGGASSARNAGLDIAQGEYIAFADADDFIDNYAYERAYEAIVKYNADCVKFGVIEEYLDKSDKVLSSRCCRLENNVYDNRQSICDAIIEMEQKPLFGYLYNTLYKASIIKKNLLKLNEDLKVNEDFAFNIEYFKYVDKFVCIDMMPYHYAKRNEGSLSSQNSNYRYQNHMLKIRGFLALLEQSERKTQVNLELLYWMYVRFVYSSLANGDNFIDIKRDSLYDGFKKFNFKNSTIKQALLINILKMGNCFIVECVAKIFGLVKTKMPILFSMIKK